MQRRAMFLLLAVAILLTACSRDEPAAPANKTGLRMEAMQTTTLAKGATPANGPQPAPGGFYAPGWQWEGTYFTKFDQRTGRGDQQNLIDTSLGYLFGLTFDLDGTCYAFPALGPNFSTNTSVLAKIDPATGTMTAINPDTPYDLIFAGPDIDSRGNLFVTGFTVGPPEAPENYAWYGGTSLWRVDKATGALTEIGDTGRGEWMDLAFDSHDRLWSTFHNKLWTLDTQTGEATFVTNITGVPQDNLPGDECPDDWQYMEVMGIAFDDNDVLYGTAIRGFSPCFGYINTPVLRIDVETGQATVVGYAWTGGQTHGGDIYPTTVEICHATGNGSYRKMTIPMRALAAHLAHGDLVPGVDTDWACTGQMEN